MSTIAGANPPIIYPESDGKPMAENTRQWRWIVIIVGGLRSLFIDRPDVFVAGDLLWYPVEGRPDISIAPDGMVTFGRPKGDRGSYLQWKEQGLPPHVVFEVLSSTNTAAEMARKRQFYQRYGVEEYYVYDPDNVTLEVWLRHGDRLVPITPVDGWVSPRLGVRFSFGPEELEIRFPNGELFVDYEGIFLQRAEARAEAAKAQAEAQQARTLIAQERERAAQERERAARLAAHLRALGIEPDEL
jgi:Uma2 family endonuclease